MTPYTPEAIKHVRQCAPSMPAATIADQLGWDLATLCDRAKRHGIELLGGTPTAELKPPKPSPPAPAFTVGRSGLKPIPIDADLHQVIASLPQRQADVLTVISQVPKDIYISGSEIVHALGDAICPQNINDIVGRIKRRLAETRRWRIESIPRRNGGHRLIDLQATQS